MAGTEPEEQHAPKRLGLPMRVGRVQGLGLSGHRGQTCHLGIEETQNLRKTWSSWEALSLQVDQDLSGPQLRPHGP